MKPSRTMARVHLLAAVLIASLGALAAEAATIETGMGDGDWRRHEIVRTYRDEDGCQLRVVSYHRTNGDVDTRESRDCGKD